MLDLSTGEFRATEFSGAGGWAQALDEIGRLHPAELLFGGSLSAGANLLGESSESEDSSWMAAIRTKTPLEDWVFTAEYAVPLLKQHFQVHSLDGLGLAGHEAAAVAAGVLLEYMRRTKQGALEHVDGLRFYERSTCLELDAVSVRNLELIEPLFAGETAQTTLFSVLDGCLTPMGRRRLRATLVRPANGVAEIDARLHAVGEIAGNLRLREELRRALDGVLDLERLLGRVALDSAGPREVTALAVTLGRLPGIAEAAGVLQAERWRELGSGMDVLADLHDLVVQTLAEEPPVSVGDGGAIRAGVIGGTR